jgi:peptidoglycan DL-endopeptidase CwlO
MTAARRRWLATALALVAAATVAVVPSAPGYAAPNPTPTPGAPKEKEVPLLGDVLQSTGKQYAKAKAVLDRSRKQQLQAELQVQQAEQKILELRPQVTEFATESYRSGRITAMAAMLNASDPNGFLERATALERINQYNAGKLNALAEAEHRAAEAKAVIDAEVATQKAATDSIAKQKRAAEKALDLVGGGIALTGGEVSATSPRARPAPRAADGSWPDESCNQEDPTTSGCITKRTLHAYQEVKRAGFKMFVGCYRPGGPYEHPKGRACDWSLRTSGFARASTRAEKLYGNNLAAFLVRNADELGILYVIWYKRIWFPATGWKSYSGDSDHTDHVHMSML